MNNKRFFLVLIVLIAIIGLTLTGCDNENPGTGCNACGECAVCNPNTGCNDCGECADCEPDTDCNDCGECEVCNSDCEHIPGEPQTTPATCIADGSTVTRCTECDEITDTVVLDKLGHDMDTEMEILTQPTYITEGEGKNQCQRCEHSETNSIQRKAIESAAEFKTVIEGLAGNTVETAYTLRINISGNFGYASTEGSLGHTLIANPNKYVNLDFSESTITEIPIFAFCKTGHPVQSSKNLVGVTIPSTVQTIGTAAFSNCSNLKSVTFQGNNLTDIGQQAFMDTSITSLTIPDSVITIGEGAFCWNEKLTSVTLGNSVQTIGTTAFASCVNLTNITIPNSVKTIGIQAFSDCDKLAVINIGTGVETIDEGAFAHCVSLSSITIPASVKTLGEAVFWGSRNLTSITFAAGSDITSFGDFVSPEGSNGNGGDSLRTAYNAANPKAGTYTRTANGTNWGK